MLPIPPFKKGFTLVELLVVISIIGVLSVIGLNSFSSTRMRARDTNRKNDLNQISKALELYFNDQGEYPDDNNAGKIMGCGTDAAEECSWGTSIFSNTTTGAVYMNKLPGDSNSSYTYYYESFTNAGVNTSYQLYARLENTLDTDVSKDSNNNPQVYTNRICTTDNLGCNYGVSSSNLTPESNNHSLDNE